MEQPPEPHPVRLRRTPAGGNSRRRDASLRRNVSQSAQSRPERVLALLPEDILREPVQTPRDRPERLQRMGGAGDRRLHVQGRDQRRAGAAAEPHQGGREPPGQGAGAPGPAGG